MSRMRTAGVRELKNRLSEYLREVRHGETVLVTDRGEVVARLGPPSLEEQRTLSETERKLGQLAARGRVRLPADEREGAFPELPSAKLSRKDFARLWAELRADDPR